MLKKFFMGAAIACMTLISSCEKPLQADFAIIPIPNEVKATENGNFLLNGDTRICYTAGDSAMKRNAEFLAEYVKQNTGMELALSEEAASSNAIILTTGLENENPEAYQLTSSKDQIVINGASPAGCFYGIQTLRKSLPIVKEGSAKVEIPAVEINDAPRFSYRGAHFDVSRHFFTVDEVKRFIDILALHNINRFHWHLTDDQGWRIEIKKYPELTKVGAYRPETVIGHNTGKYDGKPHEGHYTQDECREIVKYAAERHIIVIPEIDLPGHMQAALAAYPHLGCTGGPYKVWQDWGVSENVLCAGNDETMQFVADVLTEIVDIFPSEYIHVGGDECPKTRWAECKKCQARIKKEGLKADGKHTAEERLQSYVINFAERHLNSLGRQIIGWDETLEGGLAPNATVMSWRGEGGGIEAARQKHKVIMSPNTYLYFDYYQTKDTENEPIAIGGYLPVKTVYEYEPMPKQLSPEEQQYIIGVQANLWTEYIPDFKQVEYMELPRMAALSEVQWSNSKKDYENFTQRLPRYIQLYKHLGYNYAKHIFDVSAQFSTDTEKRAVRVALKTIDNANIHYTLDGSEPTEQSALYKDTLNLTEACTLKAAAFRDGERTNILTETFNFNKATSCPIKALQPVNQQYYYAGEITLVDGLTAPNTNYQTGRWIAFFKNDMEVVIDLGSEQEVSSVAFNTCVEKGAWIFDARKVEVYVSSDGENFTQVVDQELPAMQEQDPNKIYNHEYTFDTTKARYVKVKAVPEHKIPEWHGGKGNPSFLFVDEIYVK